MTPTPGRRATPWLIGGGAVVVTVVVAVAIALATRAGDADHGASPGPSPSTTVTRTHAPTEGPTPMPTTEPTTELWPEVAFDPGLPTQTFRVEEGQDIVVNGLRIEDAHAAPMDDVEYSFGTEGSPSRLYSGLVGTVIDVPGWGLINVIEREVIETDGRPESVLHFEVQTSAPLIFTSRFLVPAEIGSMGLTDGLRIFVKEDGSADGIATFDASLPDWDWDKPVEVEGPAGTTVDIPGWGSLTIVEAEADEDTHGRLCIETVTAFPVFKE